jgi:Zn-dependent protease
MTGLQNGSFRLFRLAGIDVFLHWTWFLGAVVFIHLWGKVLKFESGGWVVVTYLSLFAIVLMHEFGHALACRSVGGKAERIVLWPLGGVAYVNPPARPEAVLWSIAAGPLVNVFLVPVTVALAIFSGLQGWSQAYPDLDLFFTTLAWMNGILLLFNLLPVYPLDGGQILQSLLWFFIGRTRSLLVVCILGLVLGGGLFLLALLSQAWILMALVLFILFRSWIGYQQARILMRVVDRPRHAHAACPTCAAPPIRGLFWVCDVCHQRFDMFEARGVCPNCCERYSSTFCPDCYQRSPVRDWFPPAPAVELAPAAGPVQTDGSFTPSPLPPAPGGPEHAEGEAR